MQHHFARKQDLFDIARAYGGLEFIFAALERAVRPVDQRHAGKEHGAVDNAGAFELLGDRAAVVLAGDLHDLVRGERARLTGLDQRRAEADQADEGADQGERQERAEARQAGIAPTRLRFGLMRGRFGRRLPRRGRRRGAASE